jgi:hypothetical protein
MEAKDKVYGLYCVCPDETEAANIRYVGQTIQGLKTRLTNHRSHANYGTLTPLYAWMRKHGPSNIRINLIGVPYPGESLDDCEVRHITEKAGLLNLSPGGTGGFFRGKPRPDISEMMRGENHYGSILTEHDVIDMRSRYTGAYGELTKFAREFGVSVQAINDAVKGISWKHLI